MAKYIQFYKDNKEIIASDGIMVVDGRLNNSSIYRLVRQRNNSYAKNFPHKIADSYAIYQGRIGIKLSIRHTI
jgi:hypothetical protein